MRHFVLTPTLLLAACATAPQQVATPPAPPQPKEERTLQSNEMIGASANELVEHFGTPRLQVREGVGTKLQWRGSNCVLDAYLYPPESGQGLPRVTYVDARTRAGSTTNLSDCAREIEAR